MIKTASPTSRTHDQARSLRELIERQETWHPTETDHSAGCRALAIVSGKGGVGKSVLALNVAVAWAQAGYKVCLLDASLGLGSLELMCGLNGYWNLSHVVSGARRLAEITLRGPAGVDLISGGSSVTELADCPPAAQAALFSQLRELELKYDQLVIDTGAGIHRLVRQFARAADQLLVVSTPEPTSITDAYATIKTLSTADRPPLSLVVNQADDMELATRIGDRLRHTARMFLHTDIDVWGAIPWDAAAPQSVSARQPLLTFQPHSPAAQALHQLAAQWPGESTMPRRGQSFFKRLFQGGLQRPVGAT